MSFCGCILVVILLLKVNSLPLGSPWVFDDDPILRKIVVANNRNQYPNRDRALLFENNHNLNLHQHIVQQPNNNFHLQNITPQTSNNLFSAHEMNNVRPQKSPHNIILNKNLVQNEFSKSNDATSMPHPIYWECMKDCPTTSEYNPVCGSDDVTYYNPSKLICTRHCGTRFTFRGHGKTVKNALNLYTIKVLKVIGTYYMHRIGHDELPRLLPLKV